MRWGRCVWGERKQKEGKPAAQKTTEGGLHKKGVLFCFFLNNPLTRQVLFFAFFVFLCNLLPLYPPVSFPGGGEEGGGRR